MTSCLLETSTHPACDDPTAKRWVLYGNAFDKVNDIYFQNSVWFMFVTSTTCGYGEQVPTTHLGRTVAAIMTLLGINFAVSVVSL